MDQRSRIQAPGRATASDGAGEAGGGAAAPGPGKRTLTEQLPSGDSGAAMPGVARDRLERGFGASLASVRVHTGAASATAAGGLGARAFATGQDVHFAAGAYQPETPGGFHLLAHEVAHTVQAQGTAGAAPQLSLLDDAAADAGSPAEREADHAAAQVSRGIPYQVSRGTAPVGQVHAFKPSEHRDLGDAADGGDVGIVLDDGSKLSFGEAIACVDYLGGSAASIQDLAKTPGGAVKIRWVLWFSQVRSGAEPPLGQDEKKAIRNRWYKELSNNTDHFGGAAVDAYEQHHLTALTTAYLAGFECRTTDAARLEEAVAQHYLNDLFASGHIRTPRADIKGWYQARIPDSGKRLVRYMANSVADNMKKHDGTLNILDNVTGQFSSGVEQSIVAQAGPVLETASLGDIVGGAYHDEDNKGLDVVSDCDPQGNVVGGGYAWNAIGDEKLGSPGGETTKKMAIAAMKASLAELDAIGKQGVKDAFGPGKTPEAVKALAAAAAAAYKPFKAKKFIPRVDPGKPAKERKWKWNELDADFKTALDGYMKGRIFWQLAGVIGSIEETKTFHVPAFGDFTVKPREAFKEFCEEVKARGYGLLREAIGDGGGGGGGGLLGPVGILL
jgi:hypothetical protein